MSKEEDYIIRIDGADVKKPWKEQSLIDKIIAYESGFTVVKRATEVYSFFQELIDLGICFTGDLHPHYTRRALGYIQGGKCKIIKPLKAPPNIENLLPDIPCVGCDDWNRSPQHEDWGRPLRYRQLRKERIRIARMIQKHIEETGEMPSSIGCCKK